jgi:hypothetical protein
MGDCHFCELYPLVSLTAACYHKSLAYHEFECLACPLAHTANHNPFYNCWLVPATVQEYFRSMPWLAVPWEAHDVRQSLNRQFGVSGIPRLIVLNEHGTVCPWNTKHVLDLPSTYCSWPPN